MPPGRVTSRHHSNVSCFPNASMATSTPRPSVSRMIAATGSSSMKFTTSVGSHPGGQLEAVLDRVDPDDQAGATKPRAGRRAQADRALGEHGDALAELDVATLGRRDARRRDVREQDALLVGEIIRDLREVRLGVRHAEVLGLHAVDRVPEAPRPDHHPLVLVAGALRLAVRLAEEAGAARRHGAHQHPVADRVSLHRLAELHDHAHRLVADDPPLLDRVLLAPDVDVGSADRGEGDPHDRIGRAARRAGTLADVDPLVPLEDGCSHRVGHCGLLSDGRGSALGGCLRLVVGCHAGEQDVARGVVGDMAGEAAEQDPVPQARGGTRR